MAGTASTGTAGPQSAPRGAAGSGGTAVEAKGLVKRYGDVVAVAGVDLDVPTGTVLALLGPNGAGKTTTVRMLTTLLVPDEGTATVAGIDVVADPQEVRRRIGLSGQYAAVDENLTGFENLDMVGRLYHLGRKRAKERAWELLEQFRLTDAANRVAKTYSGGMRRRLDLAGALVAEPPVLFLDEPTTGLDPRSRNDMRELLTGMVRGGTTLLLTTQYLEEAERLADDIIVIDHGRVIARGTADELKTQVGGQRVELVVADDADLARALEVLTPLAVGEVRSDRRARRMTVPVSGGTPALVDALRRLEEVGVVPLDAGLRRPTMDDVFLTLTGRPAEEVAAEQGAAGKGAAGKGGRSGGTSAADAVTTEKAGRVS